MFSTAVTSVSKYTLPVIVSKRLLSGSVECGCATFVVVNPEGWVLTAAHVLEVLVASQQHAKERLDYENALAAIHAQSGLSKGQRRKQISRLQKNNMWITNSSYWWAWDPWRIQQFAIDPLRDLALGRIENFDPTQVLAYPQFADQTAKLDPGTSLCRLGFPFHEISATFDEANNMFRLAEGVLPMPRFPNDGIHTRIQIRIDPQSRREVKFIETSTPGLRGQSGGPLFDVSGRVWGIQSSTQHLSLGFAPTVKIGNKETVEHQFMHVGLATHIEEVLAFLGEHGVSYSISK